MSLNVTDDMVERAAKALYRWTLQKKDVPWAYVKDWRDLDEAYRDEWRDLARKALEAAMDGTHQPDLLLALCEAWNYAAYHGNVKDSANWPLPEGVEQIELRRGEVWYRYTDGREEFIRTM